MNDTGQDAPAFATNNASDVSRVTTPASPSSPISSIRGELRSGPASSRCTGPGYVTSTPTGPDRSPGRATPRSTQAMSLQQMRAVSHHANRVEQVDVAIIGAGLCGLSCAVALNKVRPDCVIKVYERRPGPAMVTPEHGTQQHAAGTAAASDSTPADHLFIPAGGGVRLEANGLKALTAISRKLAAAAMREGLFAQHVLLHDTETGAVISHLHDQPHLTSSSPRQPALVVGWSELEQLLLEQLPPDTVHWGAIATSYNDVTSQGIVEVELLTHKHVDEDTQQLTGSPAEASTRAVTPFQVVADGAAATGSNWGNSGSRGIMNPKTPSVAAAPGSGGSSGTGFILERVCVEARVVVAADGPMSLIRQQLAGDGPPHFDGTVRWVGRLPGDLLSTIPVAHEAWWLGPGVTFNSHPLRCGDVVWEAQVSSSALATAGLRWEGATHSLVTNDMTHDQDTAPAAGHGPDSREQQYQAAAGAATDDAAAAGGGAEQEEGDNVQVSPGDGQATDKELAAVAAAPAGEWETAVGEEVVAAARDAAAAANGDAAAVATAESKMSTQCLLQKLFALFPAPVLDMISATPPGCVLEAAVHTRPARLLPPSLGRGGVAVLGQAACPLRPTGQECSQSLEDAVELGLCVMSAGVSREALRRLEIKRRPRWKHAMQVSQALGSVSNLGGVSLHQGLLSYTTQLHNTSFVPLRTIPQRRTNKKKQLVRLAAYALLASGAVAGVSGLVNHLSNRQTSAGRKVGSSNPVERVLDGAGGVVASVSSAAAKVPKQLGKAVKITGKAEKGLQHGLGSAVSAVSGVADDLVGKGTSSDEGGSKVVYGEVPGSKTTGPVGRARDAVIGRVVSIGGFVSRPFIGLAKHRVAHQVEKKLGAF